MADVDVMRGLTAIDEAIRLSVLKGGEPGAGLHLLLDGLATTTLGASRTAFPTVEAQAAADKAAHDKAAADKAAHDKAAADKAAADKAEAKADKAAEHDAAHVARQHR